MGSLEDPFGDLHFHEETMNRLELSLADLRLRATAGCDFSQYLKDEIEHRMYRDADPDAIQLYMGFEYPPYVVIVAFICLEGLHLPNSIFEDKDASQCFVHAGSERRTLNIWVILTQASGMRFAYRCKIRRYESERQDC
jgi:hypothetical protein